MDNEILMITLKIDDAIWPKVEEYLLHQGVWYAAGDTAYFFMGQRCHIIHVPDDKHASYIMMKFNVKDFTKDFRLIMDYRIDLRY